METRKSLFSILALMIITSMVLTSCGSPTPMPAPPSVDVPQATLVPAQQATQPPQAPQATQASQPAASAKAPAITGTDRQGVPVGKYPNQYELAEFEQLTGGKLEFVGRAKIDSRLIDIFGDIPEDVTKRLPEEPLVEVPYYEIGKYGGQLEGLSLGPESGNSEYMSWRHSNLVRYDEELIDIIPNVAKDYTVNDDLTEFTFTLRKGHKWSDGEPFTVDDVMFWYEDIVMNTDLTPKVPSVYMFGGEPIKFEKVDDVTFKMITSAPASGLMNWLASTWINVFAPRHYLESKHIKYNPDIEKEAKDAGFASWVEYFFTWYGEWNDSVHRLGVPRLEAWVLVQETTEYQLMVANPFYHVVDTAGQQLPYADTTRESYIQDSQVIELKVINGEIDEKSQTLSFRSVPVFKQHEQDGNYKVSLIPSGSDGLNVGFNCTHKDPVLKGIFSNPEFNYAMSMALDRSEFNKVLCFGECEEISTGVPIHPTASFAKPEWYTYMIEYDTAKANELLDKVGLDKRDSEGFRLRPDGKRLVVFINYTIQSTSSEAMNLVKDYWEDVGVKVELKEVATEAYRSLVSNNDHDITSFTSGSTLEPSFLSNPYRFYPPFGDAVLEPICGQAYLDWYLSNGDNGEEPPADMQKLFDLTSQFRVARPGTPEYVRIGQEIGDIHMRNKWLIGIIGPSPSVLIASNRVGNFPPVKVTAFEFYRMYPYRPDQWFIKD